MEEVLTLTTSVTTDGCASYNSTFCFVYPTPLTLLKGGEACVHCQIRGGGGGGGGLQPQLIIPFCELHVRPSVVDLFFHVKRLVKLKIQKASRSSVEVMAEAKGKAPIPVNIVKTPRWRLTLK